MRSLMRQLGSAIPPGDLDWIAVPTTLIWGRHDLGVRLNVAEAACARYGWPLHVIEDARDDPAIEQPEAFLKRCVQCSRGVPLPPLEEVAPRRERGELPDCLHQQFWLAGEDGSIAAVAKASTEAPCAVAIACSAGDVTRPTESRSPPLSPRPSPTLLRMSETSGPGLKRSDHAGLSAHRPELFPRGRLEVPSGPRPGPGPTRAQEALARTADRPPDTCQGLSLRGLALRGRPASRIRGLSY